MNDTLAALTSLTEELTDRVDVLEKENDALRKRASAAEAAARVVKTAAAEPAAAVVSEQVAEDTLTALYKAGSLTRDQLDESRQILLKDAEAPHRILQKLLNDSTQVKTASADSDDVSGGRLAGAVESRRDAQADCLDRMIAILRM